MALFHHEVRLVDRFSCPTPGSAAPCYKRAHTVSPAASVHTPHVEVDLRLCTSGTYVDRTAVNHYGQGHVPDAPVMVGTRQRVAYLRGMEATCATGAPRQRAVAGAAFVGAAAAAVIVAAAALLAAGLGLAAGAWALAHLGGVATGSAVAGGVAFATLEWRNWARLHDLLTQLEVLSHGVERELAEPGDYVPGDVDERALNDAMASDQWPLQEAALELCNPFEVEGRGAQRKEDLARYADRVRRQAA